MKVSEHCVVPLPFLNENLEMPKNKRKAMKRLMYMRASFKRNLSFFADYMKLMDDLGCKRLCQ